ncbi:SGNH/GDSL hydrolase family protein [soil metagenome]
MRTLFLLFVTLLAFSSPGLIAQEPKKPAPQDKIDDVPNLPRVLIIGDSISIGYTPPLRKLLKDKANVHHNTGNGGDTARGVANVKTWLGTGKWDVIHVNFGLHDLKFAEDKHQVPVADYEQNLRKIVKELQATGATIIWCSTTPVPDAKLNPVRKNDDVIAYNAAAKKIIDEQKIAINDLYSFALPVLKDIQRPANVHFTDKGSEKLATKVAEEIQKHLKKS